METASPSPQAERRRDAMLEALAFAAQRFLERPSWSECLDDVVCRLGTAVGASRAYVFENRPPGPSPWDPLQRRPLSRQGPFLPKRRF